MRWLALAGTLAALAIMVLLATNANRPNSGPIIPADVPTGTAFLPYDQITEFTVVPKVRISRDPQNPKDGLVGVSVEFTSKIDSTLEEIQAAVWLPQQVLEFTPEALIGTNTDHWHVDLTPSQPTFFCDTVFRFKEFGNFERIRTVFDNGPTRVKLLWKGEARFFEFPGSLWEFEVADE